MILICYVNLKYSWMLLVFSNWIIALLNSEMILLNSSILNGENDLESYEIHKILFYNETNKNTYFLVQLGLKFSTLISLKNNSVARFFLLCHE